MTIATTGDERMLVQPFRDETVLLAVEDPRFGRIATVRLDAEQATELAAALFRNSGRAPEFELPTQTLNRPDTVSGRPGEPLADSCPPGANRRTRPV